ncbi:PSD1 and planctomycete cytochrome C domain-containing protein [Membranihabitans marinus]|uniref:PSD1 and planctomycete cytochrome C domain-containing protein n=1 Tax=Membranihabitans marinus TaxID=1227546 RepID=UPI001F42FA06|nr:PSD1 and planctomycete cytochrome C domain-containing protein [Membranihabitans marinus]
MKKRSLVLIAILTLGGFIFYFTTGTEEIDFSSQVKPILNKHCISCHGGVKKNAGFSVLFEKEALAVTENGHPAIVPGNAKASSFIQRLKESDEELRMPYKKPPLSKTEIKILENWVDQGAKWGKHWAYNSLEEVETPNLTNIASLEGSTNHFLNNKIDTFIYNVLQQQDLQPSPEADSMVLLRRLALDIIGLPPSPELTRQYTNGELTYENVVDSLLADENYGEKWANWWLDLSRYADSKGYEKDPSRLMWRYRDYVIKSFNDNKTFDQFTIEQLAGDLLPNPSDEQWIATAFHRNTMNNTEGGTDNEEYRVAAVLDRVNATFEVWQSTTYACIQCHSHPYDPFTHEEYYEVMAFFNNSRDEDTDDNEPNLRIYTEEDQKQFAAIADWIKSQGKEEQLHDETLFIKTLEPKLNPDEFSDFVKGELINTVWVGLLNNGHCMLKNIRLQDEDELVIKYNSWEKDGVLNIREGDASGQILSTIHMTNTNGQKIKIFPFKPQSGNLDLYFEYSNPALGPQQNSFYIEWIAFHKSLPGKNLPGYADIQSKFTNLIEGQRDLMPVMVENPPHRKRSTHVFERGNWMSLGEEVEPDVPASLNDFPEDKPRNRLGFAHWLMDADNPLTSRTVVNRIWEQIFGQGLVLTVEDMGTQSPTPIHKELLDYLSYRLIHVHQWDLKALIKDMVMSGTYRQSSKTNTELRYIDPYNRFYARGPRFRLSAEQIRDQALYVSDLLSSKMYGPSVMPAQPDGIWQTVYSGEKWETSEGEDQYRRGLYTYVKRTSPYPSFISFDAGSREICQVQRLRTNTPLQALVTLNDPVYLEAAIHMAENIWAINKSNFKASIESAYNKATYNQIDDHKMATLEALYNEAYQHFENEENATEEFLNYRKDITGNSKEIAALAVVCNAIMNLDEFITKS